MKLQLKDISLRVGAETHLYPLDLELVPGTINVLLGPTQAGKTTLMRVIAGLDRPSAGRILVDGKDVTGVSVRERKLAMVYQQFVNYPAMTVFDNIAAPLRLQRRPEAEVRERVTAMAEKLHIAHLLQRLPGALSGGQQQRCALARALVKKAPLVLLDEPLVNLDYKLREELRAELASLFADGATTVVYATTEPQEALLLGGQTVVMDAGRILQTGPTLDTYSRPISIRSAAIFNDPPMNVLDGRMEDGHTIRLDAGPLLRLAGAPLALGQGKPCKVGIRCHHVGLTPGADHVNRMDCTVDLSELSGSETYVHLRLGDAGIVAQVPGVHAVAIDSKVQAWVDPQELFIFDADGALLRSPREASHGAH
ncbi:ABC transporter ATP-binding protein [Massilia sp. YMA4]|uniref:ABC transporter ATP-binding protein n=1 Tax=Massilia sp. YMA4 TaxID=1593482 RepID=UPI000DD1665F|nr:ABC transporter ATP-binding protein [Massilia sp. YMA4]AXA94026.1 ABC transporter [Massilia sp. YMA4]